MLCDACQSIFQGDFSGETKEGPHQATVASLCQSALADCWICTQVLDDIYKCGAKDALYAMDILFASREEKASFLVDLVARNNPAPGPYSMHFTWYRVGIVPRKEEEEPRMYLSISEPRGQYIPGYNSNFGLGFTLSLPANLNEPRQYTGKSPSSLINNQYWPLELAKSWLETCISQHPHCLGHPKGWLPTRLLDLSQLSAGSVKLIKTKSNEKSKTDEPYMTLSHCWGEGPMCRLTSKSHECLLEGVPISVLPRTFQETFEVAASLGAKYIWIDSLCIMQDSVEDWEIESSQMGKVYANGLLNIAATGSQDGDGGLFIDRPIRRAMDAIPCFVTSTWTTQSNHDWVLHPSVLAPKLLLDGPLLSRGWVVQERLLARRVLHFGKKQLYWECFTFDCCETWPTGIPKSGLCENDTMNYKRITSDLGFRFSSNQLEDVAGSLFPDVKNQLGSTSNSSSTSERTRQQIPEEALFFWHSFVSHYSNCRLTMESDKLVAISGISKVLKSSMGDDYLAGMWRRNLEQDLLWYIDSQSPGRRPNEYRAPTWSWASIDGPIRWDEGKLNPYEIEVIEANTIKKTADEMSSVISAYIKLRGPIATCLVHRFRNEEGSDNKWRYEGKIDGLWSAFLPRMDADDLFSGEKQERLHVLFVHEGKASSPYSFVEGRNWPGEYYSCLLLQETPIKGTFRRCGVAFLLPYPGHLTPGKGWRGIVNEEWFGGGEADSEGKYTIAIV